MPIFSSVTNWLSEANNNLRITVAVGATARLVRWRMVWASGGITTGQTSTIYAGQLDVDMTTLRNKNWFGEG